MKLDGTNVIIKTRASREAEPVETTVATDADTKVIINGADGKLTDLKEGMFVSITPKTGTAKEIRAWERGKMPGKGEHGKGGHGKGGHGAPPPPPAE